MRNAAILFLMIVGASLRVMGQDIADVKNLRANPKTHLFNDGKHTVEGYVYAVLQSGSSCCGNDAIFVEVVFDKNGYVTGVKAMTGKNDCYKKSVCDILKNVRWESEGVATVKTIYFEVKPITPCSGSANENSYKAIAITNNPNFGGNDMASNTEVIEEVKEEVTENTEEVREEVTENTEEVAENTEADENNGDESTETAAVKLDVSPQNNNKLNVKNDGGFLSDQPANNNNAVKNTPPNKGGGNVSLPPQASMEYKPVGDRQPDPTNPDTHDNLDPGAINRADYSSGENQLALKIKQELRKTGYCGYAQAAIELTVDPNGNVVGNRIMYCNNDKVSSSLPAILSGLKFQPRPVRYNYFTIVQFKTEIVCSGKGTVDLEKQPNVVVDPRAN